MNTVDTIYYINLPHREDRKQKMLNWISESGFPKDKVNRIEAVYNYEKGYIGCTLSHIKAVETFIQSNNEICIIYEDLIIGIIFRKFLIQNYHLTPFYWHTMIIHYF